MSCPELSSFSPISALLSQVYRHPRAEFALARLIDPDHCLGFRGQHPRVEIGLDAAECAALANFRLPKRRAQWLTGRLCAKQAVIGYCRRYLPHLPEPVENLLHIGNASTGRPELDRRELAPELSHLDISISHSGDYAIALASSGLCGVDIQQRSDALTRVRERFCLDEEEDLLQRQLCALDKLWQLNLLWAAKEAAKKALSSQRMPGFLEFILSDIKQIDEESFILHFRRKATAPHSPPLRVAAALFENYALAMCLLEGEIDA